MLRKILFYISILIVCACNKTSEVGLGVAPAADQPGVNYYDGYRLTAYTIREDSLRTDDPSLNMLGSYVDPIFGKAISSFVTQFRLSATNVDFRSGYALDSLILSLSFGGYYGDVTSSSPMRIKVYELSRSFNSSESIYSNFNMSGAFNTILIADTVIVPKPTDKVSVEGALKDPQLRLRLSEVLGNKLLSASGSSNLATNSDFVNFFKGLYLTVDNPSQTSGQGSILHFNLLSSDSKLTLYYRNTEQSGQKYEFIINSDCARFNLFQKDYTNASFAGQLNQTSSDSSFVYIQSMAGTRAKITLPFLESLKDSGTFIINKAEVIFDADVSTITTGLAASSQLYLLPLNENGRVDIITDQLDGSGYYGGFYDNEKHQYVFNITRYFQELIYGTQKQYGMILAAANANTIASRVVIKGKNNIKFRLTYTKL